MWSWLFTQETQHNVKRLQVDIKASITSMQTIHRDTRLLFLKLMSTQSRLVELQAHEAIIRTTLVSIKAMLLPHMEVLKYELSIVESLLRRDANISTKDGLVDLVVSLEIQIHTLEATRGNWISTTIIVEQLNMRFLKNTLWVFLPSDIKCQKGGYWIIQQ